MKAPFGMNPIELGVIVAACSIFIVSPQFPDTVIDFANKTPIAMFFLIGLGLLASRQGVLVSLSVFLAVAAFFVEGRRRILQRVGQGVSVSTPGPKEQETQLQPAPPVVSTEVHPDFEIPSEESQSFSPPAKGQDNTYTPSGSQIEEKEVQETLPPQPEAAAKFFSDNGLAPKF